MTVYTELISENHRFAIIHIRKVCVARTHESLSICLLKGCVAKVPSGEGISGIEAQGLSTPIHMCLSLILSLNLRMLRVK